MTKHWLMQPRQWRLIWGRGTAFSQQPDQERESTTCALLQKPMLTSEYSFPPFSQTYVVVVFASIFRHCSSECTNPQRGLDLNHSSALPCTASTITSYLLHRYSRAHYKSVFVDSCKFLCIMTQPQMADTFRYLRRLWGCCMLYSMLFF